MDSASALYVSHGTWSPNLQLSTFASLLPSSISTLIDMLPTTSTSRRLAKVRPFLIQSVSMHRQTDLSTQEGNHKNHQRTASPWVSSLGPEFSTLFERDPRFGGTWDLDTISSFGIFFWIFFFLGDWSSRTGPPPSPRVQFHSASSYCRVNYT